MKANFYLRLAGSFVAAVAAAFLTSALVVFLGLVMMSFLWVVIPDLWQSFLMIAVYIGSGFAGVFVGTFFLQKRNRWIGSIFLLGFALIFYFWFGPYCSHWAGDPPMLPESWFWPLGGLAAVLFFWRRKLHGDIPA